MKIKLVAVLLASATISAPVYAQVTAPAPAAAQMQNAVGSVRTEAVSAVAAAPQVREALLPTNTEVVLALNAELSSKTHRVGDKFSLSVAQDVTLQNQVVIPKGTRAIGQVVFRTGTGGFGKSGKMEVNFRYLELNGMKIPLEGHFRQDGEGNTAATVGAVLAAGVIGGLIVKGKSARVPEGREFTVHTVDALPVVLSSGGNAVIAASYTPTAVNMQAETDKERKRRIKAQAAEGKKHN